LTKHTWTTTGSVESFDHSSRLWLFQICESSAILLMNKWIYNRQLLNSLQCIYFLLACWKCF